MTITEILTGKDEFMGLMPLILEFCKIQKYDEKHVTHIEHIINFIVARSKGEVPTGARFIRDYILKHPFYKKDSKISPCLF
jgi:glutamate--cysteine ligase catalytic subunit